jgi:NAD(P)-dependent dehydrogenase (short-subunit alcohol dehydrogenase family)
MFSLQNKHAVITGGGSGIGKAISLLFAQQGATVHIVDINGENASTTVTAIKDGGGEAFPHTCDITKQHEVAEVFGNIGKIDILVNSAGISHIGKADTTPEVDFDRVYHVNVKGVYNCLHVAIPAMKTGGGGVILNICSVAAATVLPTV